MGEPGEIYVLVNPTMPGLVKVEKTRSESAHRAFQLSGAMGIPVSAQPAWSTDPPRSVARTA
jgi:hypothetical protein